MQQAHLLLRWAAWTNAPSFYHYALAFATFPKAKGKPLATIKV